eukprot:gene15272-632_t
MSGEVICIIKNTPVFVVALAVRWLHFSVTLLRWIRYVSRVTEKGTKLPQR